MRPWSSELAPLVQGDGEGGGAVHPSSPPSTDPLFRCLLCAPTALLEQRS